MAADRWLAFGVVARHTCLGPERSTSPSLRSYAREEFEECYRDARRQALIETSRAEDAIPSAPPYTLAQALDPDFLPD